MFKSIQKRALTGIGIVASIVFLLMTNHITASILMLVIAFTCTLEYTNIIKNKVRDTGYNGIFIAGFLPIIVTLFKTEIIKPYLTILLYVSFAAIMTVIVLILFFKIHMDYKNLGAFISLFYIGIPMAGISYFLINGFRYEKEILLGTFILLWITDTGAYLVGSAIGKHKLLERISPGKTIEGSIGAGVFAVLGAWILSKYFPSFEWEVWLTISIIAWILGTMGDLYESSIKRLFNVKDSSNLLPGHGGFWDRFDSFLVVAPAILIYLKLFKII